MSNETAVTLLAEGRTREEATRANQPACTCQGAAWCEDWCPARPRVDRAAEAELWFDKHRRVLLDGYAAALEEATRLRAALSALIARVRRTGGYATPEEQDVLRAAEQALASGAEKGPRTPQERAEGHGCGQMAGQPFDASCPSCGDVRLWAPLGCLACGWKPLGGGR